MACPAAAFSGVRTSRSADRRRELFIGGLNQAIWPQQPGYGTVIGPVPPSPHERSGGQTSTVCSGQYVRHQPLREPGTCQ
jgi:hypothetical protein